jgi:hypothetical protein
MSRPRSGGSKKKTWYRLTTDDPGYATLAMAPPAWLSPRKGARTVLPSREWQATLSTSRSSRHQVASFSVRRKQLERRRTQGGFESCFTRSRDLHRTSVSLLRAPLCLRQTVVAIFPNWAGVPLSARRAFSAGLSVTLSDATLPRGAAPTTFAS